MKVLRTSSGFLSRLYVKPATRRERLALLLRGYRKSFGIIGINGWMNHKRHERRPKCTVT